MLVPPTKPFVRLINKALVIGSIISIKDRATNKCFLAKTTTKIYDIGVDSPEWVVSVESTHIQNWYNLISPQLAVIWDETIGHWVFDEDMMEYYKSTPFDLTKTS